MKDWETDWWHNIEKAALNLEYFVQDLHSAVDSFTDEVTETLDTFIREVQEVIVTEVECYLDEFVELIIDPNEDLETFLWEELDNFESESEFISLTTQQPSLNNHPACIGCRNYHGHVYNGNLLVCGMHPYGRDTADCPDWEKQI